MKRFFTKYKKDREVIGVSGCAASSGVTHLCIGIGNYLANVAGKKTAIVNLSGDYETYRQLEIIRTNDETGVFRCGKAVVYNTFDVEEFVSQAFEDYDRVVLDLGYEKEKLDKLFPFCDRKIYIGKLCEWDYLPFIEAAGQLQKAGKLGNIIFASSFFTESLVNSFSKLVGCRLKEIPFFRNPLKLKGEILSFFQELLELP